LNLIGRPPDLGANMNSPVLWKCRPIPLHIFKNNVYQPETEAADLPVEREGLVCGLHVNIMIVIVAGIGEGPPFRIDT
jgi:hypothetical protein